MTLNGCAPAWAVLFVGCTASVGGMGTVPAGSGSGSGSNVGTSSSGTGGGSSGTGSGGTTGGVGSGGTPGMGDMPVVRPATGTDPGRLALHRLNRAEYNNTVRDLLGTTKTPADDFPVDDRGSGFDNIAEVLTISPLHIDNYNSAAAALVDEALTATAERAKLVTCDLTKTGATCARTVLTAFVPLAWRRPVTTAEIDALMQPVTLATGQGDTAEQGLRLALQATLLSPHFLFRVETDPSPTSLTAHALAPYEIASRLSYFIWSSMPDSELFAAAANGTISQPATLQTQVTRMLASTKAQSLIDNFAGQWLYTRAIPTLTRDAKQFPAFDDSLRAAMKAEMETMFQQVVLHGMPANQLLTANFTYLNDRLATFYGLPAVNSTTPVKVSVAGTPRAAGLLSQGGFLAVTSHVDKTSPVLRGKWVMSQLLCKSVPPPPGNVNTMLAAAKTGTTLRETLAQHRADPSCAVCHNLMDPIGLGLENYDAVGAYRTMDNGGAIDASGTLPGGHTFTGAADLAAQIAADPNFARCMSQQLYTYALGRPPDTTTANHMDPATLYDLSVAFGKGYDFKSLVTQIASSPTFLNRRGEP